MTKRTRRSNWNLFPPVGGASDPAKREEEIHQLNTEIITGGGPDVFIMGTFRYTDSNLFPDVAKAMGNHAFLPLNAYAQAAGFQRDDYIQPALEAGQLGGGTVYPAAEHLGAAVRRR